MTQLKDILYVEDDPDIQSIAKLSLEKIGGFNVRLCDSGTAAIAALARIQPQLILLDVMMPGLDGISTYRAIREFPPTRDIPVIFITAKVQKAEREAYMNLGTLAVIEKPFDALALPESIKNYWQQYMHRNAV